MHSLIMDEAFIHTYLIMLYVYTYVSVKTKKSIRTVVPGTE